MTWGIVFKVLVMVSLLGSALAILGAIALTWMHEIVLNYHRKKAALDLATDRERLALDKMREALIPSKFGKPMAN